MNCLVASIDLEHRMATMAWIGTSIAMAETWISTSLASISYYGWDLTINNSGQL